MAASDPLESLADVELLAIWRAGETGGRAEQASRLLYQRHKRLVTRFFLWKACEADPSDLVAQTFTELFRRTADAALVESFRGLLMTIAVRVLYAYLRGRLKLRREEGDFTELCLARLAEPSPSSGVNRRHALERLLIALRDIPVESQLIIELKYLAGLSDGEVAGALGIPPTTLGGRRRRALDELRRVATHQS